MVTNRCQTAWVAPTPGDQGGGGFSESATFGEPGTLEVHFRLGTRSDLHFKLARGGHCVIDYRIGVGHFVNNTI